MSDLPSPASPLRLLCWVLDDDLDAAIDGGLMEYAGNAEDDLLDPAHPQLRTQLLAAQQRLREAWAARERYRARAARLARRAAAREARRAPPATVAPAAPSLPPAAAAILARAKAKAAARGAQ
ncbi:Na+-translocating ferredoxin:NAD+ oxidoreductase RnfC subunit [Xanthomonas translucens]